MRAAMVAIAGFLLAGPVLAGWFPPAVPQEAAAPTPASAGDAAGDAGGDAVDAADPDPARAEDPSASAAASSAATARKDERGGKRWFEREPPDPAALRAAPGDFEELLSEHGLMLDLAAGTVSMRGATLHDRESLGYPIEYLIVTEHGKTHEAAFLVKARPSVLDACLQALTLQPGAPTQVLLKDPLPPEAKIASGEVSPWDVTQGHGPLVSIDVDWIDDAGARHTSSLDGLLIDIRTGRPLSAPGWIYVGSRKGEIRQGRELVEVFMADVEGNVAAIYLDGHGTSLFERNSLDGVDDGLYTINPDLMPARNSPVTVTFKALGGRVDPRDG